MAEKTLWEILVPKYSNDGTKYELSYHQKWDEYVRSISGGLTIFNTAKGHWLNPDNQPFIEPMIPVRIYCDKPSIDKIVEYAMQHYDQQAILAYEISTNVIMKTR